MAVKAQVYDIRDVWMALKLAGYNLLWTSMIWLITSYLFNLWQWFSHGAILLFIQSTLIYFANRRYLINLETQSFGFPRSDMENSIVAIITLQPYWNLMRRKTVLLADIENIYLDTKRWTSVKKMSNGNDAKGRPKTKNKATRHIRYTLNIAGQFGSANLTFLSRQKRDEVRNALERSIRRITGKTVDVKVAELS